MKRGDDRGFAILIVLWALVLLTLVFTQLVSSGRSETELARDLRTSAAAEAAADAAFYQAVFHLLDASPARWTADGTEHDVRLPEARASVSVVDLSGRVNPNTASAALLGALLGELGAERTAADAIAEAVVEWRTPDAQGRFGAAQYAAAGLAYAPARSAFQSLEEVGLVLGMSPRLLALLLPHMSLAPTDAPDPRQADPVVLRALKDIRADNAVERNSGRPRNVMVTAAAVDQSGARFVRRATVRFGSAAPFERLSWERPAWP